MASFLLSGLWAVLCIAWRFISHEVALLMSWSQKQVVELPCGRLRGKVVNKVFVLLGVPFAEGFTGVRRWQRPVPALKLTKGKEVRDCLDSGPCCPQPVNLSAGSSISFSVLIAEFAARLAASFVGPRSWSYQGSEEGSLCLNIWCPVDPPDAPLPVMVFIHGGGFLFGSGSFPLYDGRVLAETGCIVITVNHRVGVLGFLKVPFEGAAPNRGLLDVVEALRWVRRNISALGGDPDNVTLFGESSGAMCIASILPLQIRNYEGKPLFCRAICMSGANQCVMTEGEADKKYCLFASQLPAGEATTLEDLETLPLETLFKAQKVLLDDLVAKYRGYEIGEMIAVAPYVDGTVIQAHPTSLLREGNHVQGDVELVIGTTRHENCLFTLPFYFEPGIEERTRERIAVWLRRFGQDTETAVAAIDTAYSESEYARTFPGHDSHQKYNAMATDWIFKVPCDRLAVAYAGTGARVRVYRYDRPLIFSFLGASHASELPVLFGKHHVFSFVLGFGKETDDAAASLCSLWSSLARNDVSEEDWPFYNSFSRPVASLLGEHGDMHVLQAPDAGVITLWDGLGHY